MAATGDILQTGVSGLLAYQRALATTGHNISNVNTPGYSRQRVEMTARNPQYAGNGFIGTGVEVTNVARIYDRFLTDQVHAYTASHGQFDEFHRLVSQVNNLLGDPQSGLSPGLQGFFDTVHGVANDPSSITARQVMLSGAQSLVDRFHYIGNQLDSLRTGVNSHIGTLVNEINGYAGALADLNRRIVEAQSRAGGQSPNDLLDQRDALVAEVAKRVSVSTVAQDDGSLNVFIGTGQTLVIGGNAFALSTGRNLYDPTRLEVSYGSSLISTQITGGALGATLDFRARVLDPAQNELGRLATGLAWTFNAQHHEGFTLDGDLGGDLFTPAAPTVLAGGHNAGAGAVSAVIADGAQLTASDYLLRYDGPAWTLTRRSDGLTQTGAGPFNLDGLTVTVGGAPVAGDSFLIQPARLGATAITRAISDPRLVAAAAPIRTAAALANAGDAVISAGEVLDAANANLLNTVTLNFVSATQYQVNGAGPLLAYTSGADIDINGWRVTLAGTPAAGDVFTIEKNTGGVGDNRNALLLADLRTQPLLASGSMSYEALNGSFIADIGTSTRSAGISRDAQSALLQQLSASRDSVAGVNLDEEAANLLRFQQAYQAAAQMVAAAGGLFQTLLDAVRS